MKGYLTYEGYWGYILGKGYILFCTEEEYYEYLFYTEEEYYEYRKD